MRYYKHGHEICALRGYIVAHWVSPSLIYEEERKTMSMTMDARELTKNQPEQNRIKEKGARQVADIFLIVPTAGVVGEGEEPAAHRQQECENQPRIKQRTEGKNSCAPSWGQQVFQYCQR